MSLVDIESGLPHHGHTPAPRKKSLRYRTKVSKEVIISVSMLVPSLVLDCSPLKTSRA